MTNGRGEKIRTSDPLHPMQVRYQAALRPDAAAIIPSRSAIGRQQRADFLELLPQRRGIERSATPAVRGALSTQSLRARLRAARRLRNRADAARR